MYACRLSTSKVSIILWEEKSKTTCHFVKTSNNASAHSDLLVKQFVRSL